MIVVLLKWTFWHSQTLAMVSSHDHHVSTKKHVFMVMNQFSVMQWAKQPCGCQTADGEEQEMQQKHAAIAIKTLLSSGSPVLY